MEIVGLLTEEPLISVAIKNKIKSFITPDLYRDLDDFIKDNPTFEDFKSRAKFNNAYRRALNWDSYTITEDEYQKILNELRAELNDKLRIEKEKISTVTANGKEIATYHKDDGTVIAVDNSYNNRPIESQMEDIQKKYSRFRQNGNTNTEEMMEYLQDEIKPEPTFQTLDDIGTGALNTDDNAKLEVAKTYQDITDESITVNLEDGLIMDEGTILEIQKTDEGYTIATPEDVEETDKQNSEDEVVLEKAPQKTLRKTPFKQAGFSDTILLALLTGMFIGLVILNIYIRTI